MCVYERESVCVCLGGRSGLPRKETSLTHSHPCRGRQGLSDLCREQDEGSREVWSPCQHHSPRQLSEPGGAAGDTDQPRQR